MYIQIDLGGSDSGSGGGSPSPQPTAIHGDNKHTPEAVNFNAGDTENG